MTTYYKIFASAQFNSIALDFIGNTNHVISLSKKAAKLGYSFVAFPELCLGGYNSGDMPLHKEYTKATVSSLLRLKYELPESIIIGVGASLQGTDGRIYDCYVLLKQGAILGILSVKSFLDSRDKRIRAYATSSNEVEFIVGSDRFKLSSSSDDSNILDICGVKLGIYFNEADHNAVTGADVVIIPSCVRFELGAYKEREDFLVNLSAKLNCLVLTSNLMGCESGDEIFEGRFYAAQNGKLLAKSKLLPFDREALFDASFGICKELCEYDTIVRAVSLGLFDWMVKTRSKGFALSLSGGADSALCATCVLYGQIAALNDLGFDAYFDLMTSLGFKLPKIDRDYESYIKDLVMPFILTTVYQGSDVSGDVTKTAAFKLAHNIGAKHYEWSISNLVKDYIELINATSKDNPLSWEKDDLALQNIQARVRAPGIWMMANRLNKLLIVTSNCSEACVGYCTMDGDTAGGVAPIAGISKSRILKINSHIAHNGLMVDKDLHIELNDMSYVAVQAPTAELRPGGNQTDERDLMPYVVLDEIHTLHQINNLPPSLILEELKKSYKEFTDDELLAFIVKYFDKFAKNQWKRERSAMSFHIEKADVNAKNGFVFPLLNDGYRSLLSSLKN